MSGHDNQINPITLTAGLIISSIGCGYSFIVRHETLFGTLAAIIMLICFGGLILRIREGLRRVKIKEAQAKKSQAYAAMVAQQVRDSRAKEQQARQAEQQALAEVQRKEQLRQEQLDRFEDQFEHDGTSTVKLDDIFGARR